MTTQTTLSDVELIVKGYNAVVADAQDEFEYIKDEVLLQLEDLDEDFDTYREFELRLEAYENGAFDPDIEKILGIGGRKAGTWNPISQQAKDNRAEGRAASRKTDEARIKNKEEREALAAKPGLSPLHASQFKGAQPTGERKGAGRGYKGGDLSDRDTFAGAIARKLVGGKRKVASGREKLKEAPDAARDKAAAGVKAAGRAAASGGRNVGSAAASGGRAAASGGRNVGSAVAGGGKKVGSTIAGVGTGVSNIATDLGSATAASYRGDNKRSKPTFSGLGTQRGGTGGRPGTPGASNTPQSGGRTGVNKPSSQSGGYLSKEEEYWASKSFTDRLRKSMGYRPRRRYDDSLPW